MRLSFRDFWFNVLSLLVLLGPQHGSVAAYSRPSGARDADKSQATTGQARISGLRIEPADQSLENPFYGYEGTISIVYPNQKLRIALFGSDLEQLGNVSFVASLPGGRVNCSDVEHSLVTNPQDSLMLTDSRFVAVMSFPEVEEGQIFHICYSSKDGIYRHLNDAYSLISTHVPPKVYYFPFWIQVVIITVLLVLSGLFSGLNLGLMSLNTQELQLIMKSGSETEARYAESILPVREKGNMLLCSLLIGNVLVNSGISILLDDLTGSGYTALIAASAGIVVFGEIFPQSLCVKKGLAVGANTILITKFFIVLTWPIAWPISKLLDVLLGEEIQTFDKKRILEMIKMNSSEILEEEMKIAVGAMELFDKTVASVMTTIDKTYMLPDDTILSTKMITEIVRSGFNRIPVHSVGDRNTVVSLLFVRDLALIDPDDNFNILTVCNYHQHPLRFVMEDTPVRIILEEFKKGDYHLAVVQKIMENEEIDPTYEVTGIITLEDILEEIIQGEILDETDAYYDNHDRSRRRRNQQARDAYALNPVEIRVITVQMQMVTYQWLVSFNRAFSETMITKNVLEKLIRTQCRRVDLTTILTTDREQGGPKQAKLFVNGEYTEKFLLILEGRALVTIGQDQMTFEAGPWQSFGLEMLGKLVHRVDVESNKDREKTSPSKTSLGEKKFGFYPDYSVTVRAECTYLEISANAWLTAYKQSTIGRGATTWIDRLLPKTEPGIVLHRSHTAGETLAGHHGQHHYMEESDSLEMKVFPPAVVVTATVVDETDPLLLPPIADHVDSSPLGARTLSRASLDERKNLAVNPQLEAVRRNGKGRSASESEHVELLPRSLENGSPLSDRSVLSQI